MALAGSVTGDGILVSYSADVNEYYATVGSIFGFTRYKFIETTTEEVREWVALTEAAAQAAAAAASQSGLPPDHVASYLASEDNRVVGSYKLTKTITGKTTNTPWDE